MSDSIHLSPLESYFRSRISRYNPSSYWKMRERVVNYKGGVIKKIYCSWLLYRIKKADGYNNASMGTHLGKGAIFGDVPSLPHGLNGIIITHRATIGKGCTFYQQTTVGGGSPIIGDNVLVGAGARILGNIRIGNNVNIGSNAVVNKDVPDNCTVVGNPMRIILKVNEEGKDIE